MEASPALVLNATSAWLSFTLRKGQPTQPRRATTCTVTMATENENAEPVGLLDMTTTTAKGSLVELREMKPRLSLLLSPEDIAAANKAGQSGAAAET